MACSYQSEAPNLTAVLDSMVQALLNEEKEKENIQENESNRKSRDGDQMDDKGDTY